jgi:glutaredoxin
MAINEKTKVGNGRVATAAILIILSIFLLFLSEYQTVEIIYFTNPRCVVAKKTDDLLNEAKLDFQDRIHVTKIKVNMYPEDAPDTYEVKELREEYGVYGVPEIIINGKEFTKKFTKDNLREEICKNFIIRPEACQ